MKREVEVLRRRSDGGFVLHPKGTFKGHGGIIGVAPYRELPPDIDHKELGQLVVELLELSGPTGASFSDIKRFNERAGADSLEVQAKLYPAGTSTRSLARRYQRLSVVESAGSWHVTPWRYDASKNLDVRTDGGKRVKRLGGIGELGKAVYEVFLGSETD